MKNIKMILITLIVNLCFCDEYISGEVIKIYDGDTITILNQEKKQIKIRLANIDAPEKKTRFWQ